jgi:hypothetical protein
MNCKFYIAFKNLTFLRINTEKVTVFYVLIRKYLCTKKFPDKNYYKPESGWCIFR